MTECALSACGWMVAVYTWLAPMPALSHGLIVSYGDDRLMQDQLDWRGYEADCGVAAMTPAAPGRGAWGGKTGNGVGPCVVADVVAQHHAYRAVFMMGEIVEVSDSVRRRLRFENGAPGEAWLGAGPPRPGAVKALPYAPPLAWSQPGERRPSFWPHVPQEQAHRCPHWE